MNWVKVREKISSMKSLIWSHRGFWGRSLACFVLAVGFLYFDENSDFDLRLKIRGKTNAPEDIVLLLFSEKDWKSLRGTNTKLIPQFEEVRSLTDSYYWHEESWVLLLKQLLSLNPKNIGVTFYFDRNVVSPPDNPIRNSILKNPQIIWGAQMDSENRTLVSPFTDWSLKNYGVTNLIADKDGIVRSTPPQMSANNFLGLRLSDITSKHIYDPILINYRGPDSTFPKIRLDDVMKGKVPIEKIKGKTLIIGAENAPGHVVPTPMGLMTKAEVIANIADNISNNRWVTFPSKFYQAVIILVLLLLSIWITTNYPQSVALVFLFCLGGLFATFSAWLFDSQYIWMPITTPLFAMSLSFIVFLSYQLTVNEKRTWKLEQERKYLFEIEQLKNNFVSLISHDLKNPIAKIQAIVDRLLADPKLNKIDEDLNSIRSSSSDLNRYIQSILQVTRVESSDFNLKKEAFDINDVIEEVLTDFEEYSRSKSINIESDLEPLFSIEADIKLVKEVILNLVENAIKYTPSDGHIFIRSYEVGEYVLFSVKDTGPGIDREEQAKVWDKFYRGNSHQMISKGTGLGLYLVKYFIEIHGGEVFLSSQKGYGTTIGFKIPIAIVNEEAQPQLTL